MKLKMLLSGLSLYFLMQAQAWAGNPAERTLSFKVASGVKKSGGIRYYRDHPETVTYYRDGEYIQEGLERINDLLRDRERGERTEMDPELLDILHEIRIKLEEENSGLDVVFHVISGYRSPETNHGLVTDPEYPYHKHTKKTSLHMKGRASVGEYPIDFPYPYIHVDSQRQSGQRRKHWGFTPPSCDR